MRQILLALLLIVGLAAPGYSQGTGFLATGTAIQAVGSSTCPQGTGDPNDGCAGANPNGQFRQPNAFQPGGYLNSVAATTTNYMATNCSDANNRLCRSLSNVVGVDYPTAHYTPALSTCALTVWNGTCLLDPALISIPGCTYNANYNGVGGGALRCGGSSFVGPLQHLMLGEVNGHDCTDLFVDSSLGSVGSTSLLIDDYYFFNNNGKCTLNINNGGNAPVITVNVFYSGGITMSNYFADGNGFVFDTTIGACTGGTTCNPMQLGDFGASTVLDTRGVVRNFAGRPISPNQGGSNTYTLRWDWIEGCCTRAPNGHVEMINSSGGSLAGIAGLILDHTVLAQNWQASNFGPTLYYFCNNWPCPIGDLEATNNTVIAANIGGGPGFINVSGCLGAPPTGGTSTAPTCSATTGNTFYVTCAYDMSAGSQCTTNKAGRGLGINCTGNSFNLYNPISGSYPIVSSGAPNIIAEFVTDGFNGGQYGPSYNSGLAATCTSVTVSAHVADVAFMGQGHGPSPATTSKITGNYIDPGLANGIGAWLYTIPALSSTQVTASVSGSTLTTSVSVSLSQGETVYGVGVGNCGSLTNFGNCPQIATGGTGSSFTITPAVTTPVGPITMYVFLGAWCTNPTVFSGNIDMTHIIPESWMDQWSVKGTYSPGGMTAGAGC